jgi:hypothetical protein
MKIVSILASEVIVIASALAAQPATRAIRVLHAQHPRQKYVMSAFRRSDAAAAKRSRSGALSPREQHGPPAVSINVWALGSGTTARAWWPAGRVVSWRGLTRGS